MEVIEHVDPPRLAALERAVFGDARPRTVVVTTPNVEYNVRYAACPPAPCGTATTGSSGPAAEFGPGPTPSARRYGYAVRYLPVGRDDPEVGPPTQLAVFTRQGRDPGGRGGRDRSSWRSPS